MTQRKLIEVSDLKVGNESDTFGERFPELVDKLVRSSLEDDPQAQIRFLYGATGKVSGRDGFTDTSGGLNVPAGKVIWEIKTSKGVRSDANDDYEKRKKQYSSNLGEAKEISFRSRNDRFARRG